MTKWYHIVMRRVRLLLMVFALIIFSFTPFLVYNLSYTGRIFPKTFIAGADVS